MMNAKSQILCALCGILCPLIFFGGLWPAAGFFPPPPPLEGAADIAAYYQAHTNGIRLGALLIMISAAFYIPFTAAIGAQMRRIEHPLTPVLTYTQLGAGFCSAWLFLLPGLVWTAAAFRPERPPDITQAFNDFAWIVTVMPFMLAVTQNLALGFTIISDKQPEPIFPRWVGFFNLWVALLFLPGGLLTFFKAGPFAWNGILAFWVPACVFGPWFFVISISVMRAARRQAALGV